MTNTRKWLDANRTMKAINWNNPEDDKDAEVWKILTQNFWLPEKVPLSEDIKSWESLSLEEQEMTVRVLTGLTMLDTLQGVIGAPSLLPDATTQIEEAVLCNISFMEKMSGDTELLTLQGWKKIKNVVPDDLVAQFAPVDGEAGSIEFVHPLAFFESDSERAFRFVSEEGLGLQVVSAGHRVHYEERNEDGQWVTKVAEADQVAELIRSLPERGRLRFRVATDGADVPDGGNGSVTQVSDSISYNLPIDDYTWLIKVLSDHTKVSFRLGDHSSTWANEALRVIFDRYASVETARGYRVIYTAHKPMADYIAALAAIGGAAIYRDLDPATGEYSVSVSYQEQEKTVDFTDMTVREIPNERMYCVQVPTTFLLTRNGAGTVVTGNCVHAKSYSNIFSTLISSREISRTFKWSENNQYLQTKANTISDLYESVPQEGENPAMAELRRKAASTILESFLFYSGFYLPLYWSTRAKLTNSADMIKLIIRDEAIHGYYIGYKFQQTYNTRLNAEEQSQIFEEILETLDTLHENEERYVDEIYVPELASDVKRFLKYNANKALENLGFSPLFPVDQTQFDESVRGSLAPTSDENHDFFSGSGASYVVGETVQTEDDDWDF